MHDPRPHSPFLLQYLTVRKLFVRSSTSIDLTAPDTEPGRPTVDKEKAQQNKRGAGVAPYPTVGYVIAITKQPTSHNYIIH